MIRFINIDKDFKATVTLYYIYNLYKIKRISFEQQLSKDFTKKQLITAIKIIKEDLDKTLK